MSDCCLIKKVATVEVYENKNEVRAYGFMAGDKNTPMMEVKFRHLWGEENLSKCKLRWIIVDDLGSLLVGEVPIEQDNTASIQLPNELFTGERRMKVQLTVASCDGSRILNLQQFTDLKVINNLATNEVVEPVYQMLINQVYDDTKKYLAELETSYKAKYGSLESVYAKSKASLEEYLITAQNGGNAEFLQGYNPKNFNRVENTINELVNSASSKYKVGDVVEVLGYYTAGDGAHHMRVAKSEDDGSGEQGQGGIWWCIDHSGEVNVSWFGAKGDGVADDTEAIQRAISVGGVVNQSGDTVVRKELISSGRTTFNFNGRIILESGTDIDSVLKIGFRDTVNKLVVAIDDNVKFNSVIYVKTTHVVETCNKNTDRWAFTRTQKAEINISNVFLVARNSGNQHNNLKSVVSVLGEEIPDYSGYGMWDINFKNINSSLQTDMVVILKTNPNSWLTSIRFSNLTSVGFRQFVVIDGRLGMDLASIFFDNIQGQISDIINTNPIEILNCNQISFENIKLHDYGHSSWLSSNGYKIFKLNNSSFCTINNVQGLGDKGIANYTWGTVDQTGTSIQCFVDGKRRDEEKEIQKSVIIKELQSTGLGLVLLGFFKTPVSASTIKIRVPSSESSGWNGLAYADTTDELTIVATTTQNFYTCRFTNNGKVVSGIYDVYYEIINGYLVFYLKINSKSNLPKIIYGFASTDVESSISFVRRGDECFDYERFKVYNFEKGLEVYLDSITTQTLVRKEVATLQSLDTPYYTLKMQQEGVYEDYVAYRDELHEYENSQTTDETMLLPVLQEPVIPESVKQFAEKYKLI